MMHDAAAQTRLFAGIDLAVGLLSLATQVFATAAFLKRFGTGISAATLPAIYVAGFGALAIAPRCRPKPLPKPRHHFSPVRFRAAASKFPPLVSVPPTCSIRITKRRAARPMRLYRLWSTMADGSSTPHQPTATRKACWARSHEQTGKLRKQSSAFLFSKLGSFSKKVATVFSASALTF
jgi:hypothetical protein